MQRIIASIYKVAAAPEHWPAALGSIAEASGAVGASCRIWNLQTGKLEWLAVSPAHSNAIPDIRRYSALDPYTPIVANGNSESWVRLTERLAPEVLRKSEWYCDYLVAKTQVHDIWGQRLVDDGQRAVIFTMQQAVGQRPIEPSQSLSDLIGPLAQAARLYLEFRGLRQASLAAARVTAQLRAGVILADGEGRVVDVNDLGERLLLSGAGLSVKDGLLRAPRNFETARLHRLIANAVGGNNGLSGGRMLVARGPPVDPLILTITPLIAEPDLFARPLAMIIVSGIDEATISERELGELFGLSPAESRLAIALGRGQRLAEIAVEREVKMPTLRTQMRSIFKKLEVQRQADLVRLLSRVSGGGIAPEG